MSFKFMLGADPELFIKNAAGAFISAHDLVPGSKKAPYKVTGGAVQPDGLAAEFNIDPVPVEDFAAFDKALVTVMKQLKDMLPEGSSFSVNPSTTFDLSYYESLPASAKELGCDPDFCAYSKDPTKPNKRPDGSSGLRSAAGHIHIGWGADIPADHPDHLEICRSLVKQLDLFVGLAMTTFDTDTERRKLYGKAGAYRPKSYGLEYRTPSNAWLSSRQKRQFIHSCVNAALRNMQSSAPFFARFEPGGMYNYYGDIQQIINTGDVAKARTILRDICSITVPSFS